MNILMLGWELPPHNSGGLGVACYHMSKALAINGAKIDFVVPYKAHHPDSEFMTIHSATNLKPNASYGLGAYDSDFLIKSSNNIVDDNDQSPTIRSIQRRYIKFVENLVENNDYDIIHAHDWLTLEAGVRAKQITGLPLVSHVHATEFDRSGSKYGNPIVHDIEYQGLMMSDRVLAVSNITKI